jgi:Ni/Co efflux regulator RcnB
VFAQDNHDQRNNDEHHDQSNNNRDQGHNHDRGNNHDNHQYVRHNEWKKGAHMQQQDWGRGEPVDYRANHLNAPRRGYEWRRVDGNYVMAAVATGVIFSVIAASAAH